ncbi:MAG: FixH family protein [Hyphomicrobiaceae bacterium]|nr:FixH family protein [Hyphomicrobiaceae bacterium]
MSTTADRPITGRTVLYWLLGFFGVMFVANGFFIYFAMESWPGTVTESAFTDSQNFNTTRNEALDLPGLEWQAGVDVDVTAQGLAIVVTLGDAAGNPVTGLELSGLVGRPASDRDDHVLTFAEVEAGRYRAEVETLGGGYWALSLRGERGEPGLVYADQRRIRIP